MKFKRLIKSSSAEIFEKLIDKMYSEISKTILRQTLTFKVRTTRSYTASISIFYDNNSAVIVSNLEYAAIHQIRGHQAGRNKPVETLTRPYLIYMKENCPKIIKQINKFLP